ncbi:MAG: peptide-methionine (S)-S-oxide reductase MsrA [Chitinophagaceae bacterium]
MKTMIPFAAMILLFLNACGQSTNKKENKPSKNSKTSSMHIETITLGNGCFWCTEAVFQQVNGVISVSSGYSGGHVVNPTYEQVCEKNTGHAEVLQVRFDTTLLSVDELLEIFWQTHDPTTLNRQGNDVGPQYRSVIFYHNQHQKERAEYFKKQLDASGAYSDPIVTAIEPFTNFYIAENYHQNYYNQNGSQPYCYFVIRPKLEKFEKAFKDKLKPKEAK